MKRNVLIISIFTILSCVIIYACSSKKRQDVALKQIENESKINSKDSLSLIAWGDTRFGMTKQDVVKSKAFAKKMLIFKLLRMDLIC